MFPSTASAEVEIFREIKQEENVIDQIAAAQREELEQEIPILQAEAGRVAEETRERVGEVLFLTDKVAAARSDKVRARSGVGSGLAFCLIK